MAAAVAAADSVYGRGRTRESISVSCPWGVGKPAAGGQAGSAPSAGRQRDQRRTDRERAAERCASDTNTQRRSLPRDNRLGGKRLVAERHSEKGE